MNIFIATVNFQNENNSTFSQVLGVFQPKKKQVMKYFCYWK